MNTNRTHESPDTVTATLIFMIKDDIKPYIHTEALTGASEPHYFAKLEEREVTIHDGRPLAANLSLDKQGFELHKRDTAVADLHDDKAVKRDYYPEVEALIKEATGAQRVVIFDHTRRTDAPERSIRGPASRVHNDYTERSGPQRIRDVLGEAEAEAVKDIPVAQINLWRPIRGPVKRSPLALLNAASLGAGDLLATDMIYPNRTGEIYHLAYNPNHRWYYFPDMRREEVLLIKGYDSRRDGRARFTPHTAFHDPNTPDAAPPRESIEIRALAFFG
ncbi:methyltransferase [Litchfieldella qijiaojingensis]|uniref:Methyltransferase n=1 Tax=Litchfieldella qijiaojingensis TaxID=980347 RepID=A0ABQ2YA89_9GAMM|nr:CmcJ/NvfI family oxidoreductase [Halomonas qijiaojingensis]GGX77189.1 methyltransferase [Halomonas qijiaojingensis]